MLNKNQLILLTTSLIVLILSGFLFWQGLSYQSKILLLPTPSPDGRILGQEANSATTNHLDNQAKVVRVIDGDTIEIEQGGSRFKLRYIGVDTPETVDPKRPLGCFGKEASNENRRLVELRLIEMEKDISDTDKFGRLLRYVYLKLDDGNKLFVNDYLIRQGFGYAATFPPDVKYAARFQEAQREAEENQRGLWEKCK